MSPVPVARPIALLVLRDLRRLARRPSQIVATAGVPLLFALVLGSGFAEAPLGPTANTDNAAAHGYAAYIVPGAALLSVVFAATFAGMGLIEDRHDGALRAITLSPMPPSALAAARLISTVILALLPASLILAAGLLFTDLEPAPATLAALGALTLASVAVGGVSLALAWAIDSPRGFHGVLNLGLMPAWLLSGAVFPPETASGWIAGLTRINPLGWTHAAASDALGLNPAAPMWAAWGGAAATAAAGAWIAVATLAGPSRSRRAPRHTHPHRGQGSS